MNNDYINLSVEVGIKYKFKYFIKLSNVMQPPSPIIYPNKIFSVLAFVKKNWYWLVLLFVLLPSIISAIQISIKENNPTYPFFLLGTKILSADSLLQKEIDLLKTNPSELIGMEKPASGLWKTAVFYFMFSKNVILEIIGNVWLIFLPLVIIYKIIKGQNLSEPYKNVIKASIYFLIYLFVVNSVILIHGLIQGNTLIPAIPQGENTFLNYLKILVYLLPFHGLFSLLKYLIFILKDKN